MRIKIFGYRGLYNSTERIENELEILGHTIISSNSDCDCLIHLTGGFTEAQTYYNNCSIKPIRIYCLLDIDPNKDIYWYSQIKKDLEECEIPCVISETVKQDVIKKLNIQREIKILPHPIRDITFLNYKKTLEFVYCSRLYSRNKRFNLVLETLDYLGIDRNALCVAGTEKPPQGTFLNSPNDEVLNEFINSARFLFSPSSSEGLNLNIIQAVIANCYPIVTNDCDVNYELGLQKFMANPDPFCLAQKINHIKTHPEEYDKILNDLRPKFLEKFSVTNIAKKIISLYEEYKNKSLP